MAVFDEPTKWKTSLVNKGDTNTIPQSTTAGTGEASFDDGFPQITQVPIGAGGIAPDRKDFNGLFKILGDWIFFAQNGGIPAYSTDFDYVAGRVVLYGGNIYKCIKANGTSSTVVAPDSDDTYWKQLDSEQSSGASLIPNQIITSPVPLTDANLHLLDGALLSGSGAYSAYVSMMANLYNDDPTATCWTDEESWQSSINTYGECGKFVYDTISNTLRLPKLTTFIQATSTANELGSLVEAGAPNIEGKFIGWANPSAEWTTEGAFTKIQDGVNAQGTSGTGYRYYQFDASLSNQIYGSSGTIQPQAIKYYFYIVVGTVSKTDIQIDIDKITSDLALKADKYLVNVTAPVQSFKSMLIGWMMPDYARQKDITDAISTTAASIKITHDAYILFTCNYNGDARRTLIIDGIPLITISTSAGLPLSGGIVPISEGVHQIKLDAAQLQGSLIALVPCKGGLPNDDKLH